LFHQINVRLSPSFLLPLILTILVLVPYYRLANLVPADSDYGYKYIKNDAQSIIANTKFNASIYIFSPTSAGTNSIDRKMMMALDYEIFQHNITNAWNRSRVNGIPPVDTTVEGVNLQLLSDQEPLSESQLCKLFKKTNANYIYFLGYSAEFYQTYSVFFANLEPNSLFLIDSRCTFKRVA
jgi:hypothetical protein